MYTIKKQNSRKSAAEAGAFLVALLTAPAYAQSANAAAEDTVQITISKQDLRSEQGIQNLYDRLKGESKTTCKGPGRIAPAGILSGKCLAEQLRNFVSAINHQGLSDYHKQQAGQLD